MSTNFPGSPHTVGFVGFSQKSIFQAFLIRWVFLLFPMPWEIDEKTHTFPIWWSIQQDGNLMEKNHPFYWKSMGTNFPGIPHSMDFTMLWEIWWENPCIAHVMKYTIGWQSNGKKHPYSGKSMSTNFPGSPHTIGFLGYYWEPICQIFLIRWVWLWENICISHVLKYYIKWESNGKKATMLREK